MPSLSALKTRLSTSHPAVAALAPSPVRDASGFWEVISESPGRGMSCRTFAQHVLPNGVAVFQHHYQPGPFDALAFGADSSLAQPHSTYEVYTGVHGQPDELTKAQALALVLAAHPAVDVESLNLGDLSIWSPDGEGAVYWKFSDLQVEDALRFARSLDAAVILAN